SNSARSVQNLSCVSCTCSNKRSNSLRCSSVISGCVFFCLPFIPKCSFSACEYSAVSASTCLNRSEEGPWRDCPRSPLRLFLAVFLRFQRLPLAQVLCLQALTSG